MQTTIRFLFLLALSLLCGSASLAQSRDLEDIKKAGVIRHIGVPYAAFVTGSGDGLDVEVMQRFAAHLGVEYEYVPTDWKRVIGDLSGLRVKAKGSRVTVLGETEIRGDVIANGLTMLPWRQQVVDYAKPTFPSGVWLIAKSNYGMSPITPSGNTREDIGLVKSVLDQRDVLTMPNTCLDANLYNLDKTGVRIEIYDRSTNLNEMIPAILSGEHRSEMTLLDVPDALIALERWPARIKVIGPVSEDQFMAPAFNKKSPQLRQAFNAFMDSLIAEGTYRELVAKYYPSVFYYFPDFLSSSSQN